MLRVFAEGDRLRSRDPDELGRRQPGEVALAAGTDPEERGAEQAPVDENPVDTPQPERRDGPRRVPGRLLDLHGARDPRPLRSRRCRDLARVGASVARDEGEHPVSVAVEEQRLDDLVELAADGAGGILRGRCVGGELLQPGLGARRAENLAHAHNRLRPVLHRVSVAPAGSAGTFASVTGSVAHIHISAAAGSPMVPRRAVEARARVGLTGDRYAAGAGYWRDDRVCRDLTLVEGEVVDGLARLGIALGAGELRRNVTTRGVDVNRLLGSTFWIGDVLCFGTELCEPCRHLEQLVGKPVLRPLVHRGGLRARILTGGTIRVGDRIEPAQVLDGVGVLVVRRGDVLLGERLAAHGRGTWAPPGGKPHAGEATTACALRELEEETGLRAQRAHVVAETVDGFPESRLVFRTRFVEVVAAGRPRPLEPDKTAAWRWHGWSALPSPLFAPVASLVASGYAPPLPEPG